MSLMILLCTVCRCCPPYRRRAVTSLLGPNSDRKARSATVITANQAAVIGWTDKVASVVWQLLSTQSTLTEAPLLSLTHTYYGPAYSFDARCEARHVDRLRDTRLHSLQLAMEEK
jgi:hypothetical protein